MYIGTLLPDHGVGNPDFWLVYVGDDPPHWEDPGGVLPPDGTADYGE